jgi:hypothetical protein
LCLVLCSLNWSRFRATGFKKSQCVWNEAQSTKHQDQFLLVT